MGLPVNSSIDFPAGGSGYTFDSNEVEFIGGTMEATGDFIGSTDITTPIITTSSWTSIQEISFVGLEESPSYYHLFLISRDGGTTWETFDGVNWFLSVKTTSIGTVGMRSNRLAFCRSFFPPDSGLRFFIRIVKSTLLETGTISGINVTHTIASTPLETTTGIPGEPPASGDSLSYNPMYPIDVRFLSESISPVILGGYPRPIGLNKFMRASFNLVFRTLDDTGRDDILTFIKNHEDQSFSWNPQWESTSKEYVFLEHSVTKNAPGCFDIEVSCLQVFNS